MAHPSVPKYKVPFHLDKGLGHELRYKSFSGVDMKCGIMMDQQYNEPNNLDPTTKLPFQVFAELQTITVTSFRSTGPVRVLGESQPRAITRGARTIGGSMVFAQFDINAFQRMMRFSNRNEVYNVDEPFFIDQIPPFDIICYGSNEYGNEALLMVGGVTIGQTGTTLSVHDIFTESTYCVDETTEALTNHGWKKYQEITEDDLLLTIHPQTKKIEWQQKEIYRFDYSGDMVHWKNSRGVDYLTTPNHRWLTTTAHNWNMNKINADFDFQETQDICQQTVRILVGGGDSCCFSKEKQIENELVELIGWFITEGTIAFAKNGTPYALSIAQSESANPTNVEQIRRLVKYFSDIGTASEYASNRINDKSQLDFYFGKGVFDLVFDLVPNRNLTPEFLCSLTHDQALLLMDVLIKGDGNISKQNGTTIFIQNKGENAEMFQMLCAMLGKRTVQRETKEDNITTRTTVYRTEVINGYDLENKVEHYTGVVWCPRTQNGTWLARRNGCTFWTGNTYTARYYIPWSPAGSFRKQMEHMWFDQVTAGSKTFEDWIKGAFADIEISDRSLWDKNYMGFSPRALLSNEEEP